MTKYANDDLINQMMDEVQRRENTFPIIDDHGAIKFPILTPSGLVRDWDTRDTLKGYRGLCLEQNDHGNVTVWKCFANGKRIEVTSRV